MDTLPLDAIQPDPDQPRKDFDEAALRELADSIASMGIVEPIVVRPVASAKGRPGHYAIVAGERRWRAAAMAGLCRVPVVIRDDLDERTAFEVAMVENVLRADMNPMEEADGYQRLLSSGMTVADISRRIGKSTLAINFRLRLLGLAPALREMVAKGQLSARDGNRLGYLSTEGQYRVLRAMNEGRLPHPNDVERMCMAIYAEEQQTAMFAPAEVETLTPERQRASRDLAAELDRAAAALRRVEALLADGLNSANVGVVAERIDALRPLVTRLANEAKQARATQVALDLEAA